MIFDAHGDILTDIYEENLKGNKDSFRTKHYPLYQKAGITHSIFVNWTDPDKNADVFDGIFDEGIKHHETNVVARILIFRARIA